jgi:hypothetical protein
VFTVRYEFILNIIQAIRSLSRRIWNVGMVARIRLYYMDVIGQLRAPAALLQVMIPGTHLYAHHSRSGQRTGE